MPKPRAEEGKKCGNGTHRYLVPGGIGIPDMDFYVSDEELPEVMKAYPRTKKVCPCAPTPPIDPTGKCETVPFCETCKKEKCPADYDLIVPAIKTLECSECQTLKCHGDIETHGHKLQNVEDCKTCLKPKCEKAVNGMCGGGTAMASPHHYDLYCHNECWETDFDKEYGTDIDNIALGIVAEALGTKGDASHLTDKLRKEIHRFSDERIGRLREAIEKVDADEATPHRCGGCGDCAAENAKFYCKQECLAAFDQALTREGEGK